MDFNSRLFLVCPTDGIEPVIREKFSGESYFFTALGLHFDYDLQTENDLFDVINSHNVREVILVSSIENEFYKKAFENQDPHDYTISRELSRTKELIFKHSIFSPNFHLLAAQHLGNEKKRLISTDLGDRLQKNNIAIEAYTYLPTKEAFCNLDETRKIGRLLDNVSCN